MTWLLERGVPKVWWAVLAVLVLPLGVQAFDAGDTRVGTTWTKLGHEHIVEAAVSYLGSPYASPDERRAYRWLGQELGCNYICGKSVEALCDTANLNCGFYTASSKSISACVPSTCDWKKEGIEFASNYLQFYAAATDYLYDWWLCDDPDDCETVTSVPFSSDGYWGRQHHFLDLKWNPTYDGSNWWTGNGKGMNGFGGYGWRRAFLPSGGSGWDGDDWAKFSYGNDFWGHVGYSGLTSGYPNVSTVGSVWFNGCDSPIHGQYRNLPSPCMQSEYAIYTDTTNYPVSELVRFWFNRFHDGLGGTTPSGSKALFKYVGMSLHGLGDVGVTQHTHSTMGNNHSEYEEWVDGNFYGANVGGKPFNNFEDACVARVNQGAAKTGSGYAAQWEDAMGYTRYGTASVTSPRVDPSSTIQNIVLKDAHQSYGSYSNMSVDMGNDITPAARTDSSVSLPSAVAGTALTLTKAVNRWYSFYNLQQTPNLSSGTMGFTPACEGNFDLYALDMATDSLIQKPGDGSTNLGKGTAGFSPGWVDQGGVLVGKPGAVWRTTDNVDVYGIGTNRHVYQKWWSSTSGWSGWNDMGAPPNVLFPYGPDADSMRSDHVEFFAVGNDGNLWHRWWFQSSGWSDWASEGHPMQGTLHLYLKSAPTSVSWGDGRVDVFAKASDGNIWQKSYTASFGWGAWVNLGGSDSQPFDAATGVTAFTGPELLDATSWGTQRLDLFALGSDRAIWHRAWDGRWSNWHSLGGVCTSNPTAVARSTGRIALFCRGTDNGVFWKFFQGNTDGSFYPYPNGTGWSEWAKFSNDSGDSYYGMDAATRYKPHPSLNDSVVVQQNIPLLTGSGSYEFWGTTAGLTNDAGASCGGGAGSPDAVFGLHLDGRSKVVLNLAGSLYDTVLFVRRSDGTEMACNDDSNGTLQSALTLTLDPGDYSLFVDGYSTTNSGGYKLTASVTPLNDTVATAYRLPRNGGTFTGTTIGLANDLTVCNGSAAPDAVYQLVLDRSARVQLDTVGSSFATSLGVVRSDGVLNTCGPTALDGTSRVDTSLSAGTWYIYVDGVGSSQGNYQLNVNIQ